MEAFPSIALLSHDEVLHQAIAGQIRHCFKIDMARINNEAGLEAFLHKNVPYLLLWDSRSLPVRMLEELRYKHPFMGIITIGDSVELPLSASATLPLSIPNMIPQIERLLYERTNGAEGQAIPMGPGVIFYPSSRIVTVNNQQIGLTDKECLLLVSLLHHGKQGISRNHLLAEVWGYTHSDITTHTLETHLSRLRNKLHELMGEKEFIRVQDGVYYPVMNESL